MLQTHLNTVGLILGYDSPALRTSVMAALNSEPDLILVGAANSPELLLESINNIRPDVVVIALSPQSGFGHSYVQLLATTYPDCHIVLLGPNTDAQLVAFLISLGAIGYVCQESPTSVLLQAIRTAAEGCGFIDPCVKPAKSGKRGLVAVQPIDDGSQPKFLSYRETEVLRLLAQGFTNQEVARQLLLSIKSAETYRVRLSRKLGAKTRSDLFRYAFEHGLVSPDRKASPSEDSPARLAEPNAKSGTGWIVDTGDFVMDVTDSGAKDPTARPADSVSLDAQETKTP